MTATIGKISYSPASPKVGDVITLSIPVIGTRDVGAVITYYLSGAEIGSEQVLLHSGVQTLTYSYTTETEGVISFCCEIIEDAIAGGNIQLNASTSSGVGAAVTLDGLSRGIIPLYIPGVSPGVHTLQYTKTGYYPVQSTVNIITGQTLTIDVTLEFVDLSVYFTSSPSGASVYYGSTLLGVTPFTREYSNAGNITITYKLTGYADQTKTMTLIAGQNQTFFMTMVPLPGSISATSSPTGSTVSIGGIVKGVTPLTITGVTPGTVPVTFTLSGYTPQIINATVVGGQTVSINCSLVIISSVPAMFFPSDYFWNVKCKYLPVASNNSTVINYLNTVQGGDGGTTVARLGIYESFRFNLVNSSTIRKYLTYFNEDNGTTMGFETWSYQDYTSAFPVPPNATCQPNYPAYTVKSVTDSTHFKDTALHCAAGNYVIVQNRGGSFVASVNATTFEVTLSTSIPGMVATDPYTVTPGQIMGTLSENLYIMVDGAANMLWVIYDGRLGYRVADHKYSPTIINGRLISAPGEMACKISVTENLTNYALKPVGTYGISMSGLDPVPGYIRKSELDAGIIKHALYATGYHLGNNATRIYPARTSSDAWSGVIPCGTRLRLKSDSATTAKVEAYTGYKRTILRCLQDYGCYMLDNDKPHKVGLITEIGIGLSGQEQFLTILPTDFESVNMTSIIINELTGQVLTKAEFSATPLTGTAPYTVTFTDLSTNNPISWAWNFGDGTTSTSQNPTHTYTTPGTYSPTLTTTSVLGTKTVTKTSYITVNTPSGNVYYIATYPGLLFNGTEQTALLQTALNYAKAQGKTVVSFPAGGSIGIKGNGSTTPITFPSSMEYIGNGCLFKTINLANIGHWVWTYYVGTNTYMHGMVFDGNMANQHTDPDPDYYFPKTPNDGVVLRGSNTRFEDNEVRQFGGYMVEVLRCDGVTVKNNYLHHGWQYAVCLAGYPSDVWCTNALVDNNTIYKMGQVGVKILHSTNCTVRNNIITMPAIYDLFSVPTVGSQSPTGIRLYSADGESDHITITGNTITGTGANGETAIESDSSENTYITCTLNTLINVRYGIKNNFPNSTVTGNVIGYTTTCMYSVVAGNTCNHTG